MVRVGTHIDLRYILGVNKTSILENIIRPDDLYVNYTHQNNYVYPGRQHKGTGAQRLTRTRLDALNPWNKMYS